MTEWRLIYAQEISVVYTDSNNLIHNVVYNSTSNHWVEGDFSNQKFISSPDSSLSVTYNQCASCENSTIIAYQDINGFVQIGVQTSARWRVKHFNLHSIVNTGLALKTNQDSESSAVGAFLVYQRSDLNISAVWWRTTDEDIRGKVITDQAL